MSSLAKASQIISHKDLLKWQSRIKDVNFECPLLADNEAKLPSGSFIVSVVDCSEEGASYRYNYKV